MPYSIERTALRSLRSRHWLWTQLCSQLVFASVAMEAQGCVTPTRPYVPSEPRAAYDYADIIKKDFEDYFTDIQQYFRCLDAERARAFEEAREVSEDYEAFLLDVREN